MDVVSAACISAVIRCVCMCVFCVRMSPPVWFSTDALAAAFGEAHVCVCRARFEDQLGFQRLCVCVRICLSDVTVRVAAVSCCSRAKHTVLTGLIN